MADIKLRCVVLVTLLAVLLPMYLAAKLSEVPSTEALNDVFNDKSQIQNMINCFLKTETCTSEQNYFRERANAMMRNLGRCPRNLCTVEDEARMQHSMELLQTKYPGLFGKLIASMFGLNLGR